MVPEQAVFGLKVALHELRQLIEQGLSPEAFEETREYLSKNVFVTTKTQDQQLGDLAEGCGQLLVHPRHSSRLLMSVGMQYAPVPS
jgi:hypothetical protein